MIGVFALAGWPPEALDRHARALADTMGVSPAWQRDTFAGDRLACGRIGPPKPQAVWQSLDGRHRAWLDGYAEHADTRAGETGQEASAGELARAVLEEGPEALSAFQGEFLLLLYDQPRQKLFVATDRFGLRTTYWYGARGWLAVCSELGALVRHRLVPAEINKPYVVALLRFNKCRLGEDTLFAGVEVVPPGVVMEFDVADPGLPVHRHVYYRHALYDEEGRTEQEWIDELIPLIRSAARRALAHHEKATALLLSGGLDSRLLLAALDEEQRKQLFLLSFGLPDSDEVRIAAQVAARVEGRYQNVDIGAKDYLDWASSGVRRNEEFDIFVQAPQIRAHQRAAAEAGAAMGGWDLDVPLRGTYLNAKTLAAQQFEDVKDLIHTHWTLCSQDELASLLQEPFYREWGEAPEAWLDDILAAQPAATPLKQYLLFIFLYEKRRLLMLRNRMLRFELETVTPFYDTPLQMALSGLPERMKADNRLFARLLNQLDSELAALPYQRTMLPANVPVAYWKRSAALERQREALLRDIFVETGIRVPYKRYYSNFDEWLASDPDWIRFARELLESSDTLIVQEWVEASAVSQLLERHRTESAQYRKLVMLLSLELYLRTFFS